MKRRGRPPYPDVLTPRQQEVLEHGEMGQLQYERIAWPGNSGEEPVAETGLSFCLGYIHHFEAPLQERGGAAQVSGWHAASAAAAAKA